MKINKVNLIATTKTIENHRFNNNVFLIFFLFTQSTKFQIQFDISLSNIFILINIWLFPPFPIDLWTSFKISKIPVFFHSVYFKKLSNFHLLDKLMFNITRANNYDFFLVKIRLLTNLNIFCELKQHWVPIRFIPALLNGIVNCLLRESQSIHTDNNIKKKK